MEMEIPKLKAYIENLTPQHTFHGSLFRREQLYDKHSPTTRIHVGTVRFCKLGIC